MKCDNCPHSQHLQIARCRDLWCDICDAVTPIPAAWQINGAIFFDATPVGVAAYP